MYTLQPATDGKAQNLPIYIRMTKLYEKNSEAKKRKKNILIVPLPHVRRLTQASECQSAAMSYMRYRCIFKESQLSILLNSKLVLHISVSNESPITLSYTLCCHRHKGQHSYCCTCLDKWCRLGKGEEQGLSLVVLLEKLDTVQIRNLKY